MSNPFDAPESSNLTAVPHRQTMKLKHVGVWSAGVFGAAAGLLFGVIAGGFIVLFSAVGGNGGNAIGGIATAAGLVAMYSIGGFIGTMIYAIIYNIVAGISGGIEVEFGTD